MAEDYVDTGELCNAVETVIERLQAWQHGERTAAAAAESKGRPRMAEQHRNRANNYAKLVGILQDGMSGE